MAGMLVRLEELVWPGRAGLCIVEWSVSWEVRLCWYMECSNALEI